MYRPLFKQKSLSLRLIVEEGMPEGLEYDSFRMNQVLINLIGNGAKFTKKGGLTIHASWHPMRLPAERPAQLKELLAQSAREQLQSVVEDLVAEEETEPGRWCEQARYLHEPHSNNLRDLGSRTMSHPASPLLAPKGPKRLQHLPSTDLDLKRFADSSQGEPLTRLPKPHPRALTPDKLRESLGDSRPKEKPDEPQKKARRSGDSGEALARPNVSEPSSRLFELAENAYSAPLRAGATDVREGMRKKSHSKRPRKSESSLPEEDDEEDDKAADLAVDLPQDGFVKIQIVDTGIGITEEARARLFQPFVQANSGIASQYGGTGLGLYISKTIVCELMGGKITIDSKPMEGSNFIVVIPMTTAPSAAKGADPVTLQSLATLRFDGKRALVIDDQDYNIAMMKALLYPHGLEVAIATDGLQGLAIYKDRRQRLDVVITDLRMPNMSGQELIQAIRQHETDNRLSPIPIIVLTGEPSEAERVRCLSQLQASLYYRKPVAIGEFLPALARLLSNQAPAIPNVSPSPAKSPNQPQIPDRTPSQSQGLGLGLGQDQGQGQSRYQSQNQTQTQGQGQGQGQEILVVDDDVFSNGVVANLLRMNGYRVVQMFSRETAVKFYKSSHDKVKYILLDSQLTDGRGVDVLEDIRQFEVLHSLPPIRVISLSGSSLSAQEAEYAGMQIHKFLTKPVNLKNLIAAVKT